MRCSRGNRSFAALWTKAGDRKAAPPMKTSPHATRQSRRKIVLACLAAAIAAAGRVDAAAPVDSEVGLAVGVPPEVRLTDAWTGAQYSVAVQADRDVNGKLVLAHLVVTRASDHRNLLDKPRVHGLQPDDFAALDFAKGAATSAFWDRRIPVTNDDVLVVRIEDAQVRAVPGAPVGQVGSEEIVSLRLHVFLDSPTPPHPTPRAFVSEQYGLTFRTPPHSFFCGLPADWAGSDHGTIIFLARPKRCFGAGYPSSGRGFSGDPSRIEVFYAYDVAEDESGEKPPRCHEIARATFINSVRPLCSAPSSRGVQVSVSAKYTAGESDEAELTLVTSRARLKADLIAFRNLLQSARTCTATWHDDRGGKPFNTGAGPPCPGDARFF